MNKGHEGNQDLSNAEATEMLPEYDFSGGARWKYAARYKTRSNIVVLDEDVAQAFPNAQAVNEALRSLIQLGEHRS